jgi:hypothetical protein
VADRGVLTDEERDLIDDPRKRGAARTVWILPLGNYGRKETCEYGGLRYG